LEPITKQFNFEQTFQMKNFQDAYKSVQWVFGFGGTWRTLQNETFETSKTFFEFFRSKKPNKTNSGPLILIKWKKSDKRVFFWLLIIYLLNQVFV
jgi:hypothetical protein